ncbi:uncharacterized protein B0T15DRAFT_264814 [Chaetomium strumarium]|uniref:Uncharacterized protein n=1 Tax=Chaetomium strumarium TaxID=1170767 RepID=A0AAJ0LZ76_9PEZI|nr:hypothetical protein B0T15DRAFT_264814 [Chaetomium strumarium]
MSAVNGATGKPAKVATRPSNRPIVPVLPLNYPQRPANKPPSAGPATSPPTKGQNGARQAENKSGSHGSGHSKEPLNGDSTELGPNSADNADATTPPAAPVQTVGKAEPSASVAAPNGRARDTSTVSPSSRDHHAVPAAQHRPQGIPNVAPQVMATSGLVPDGPIPAPHPAVMNRPTFHQPHPSSGSLMFSGFYDSNASSPAPRSGGGGFPPPGLFPYPPAPVDGYGRPLLVSPAVEVIGHHGPPTPHSFHGSQSSAQAEDAAFNHHAGLNGHAEYIAEQAGQGPIRAPGMNPPMNGTVHPTAGPVPGYQSLLDQDEALSFLRHGITDSTFNDCVLEVRFPDTPDFHDHPGYRQLHRVLRTPGHRFIFSRSPTLAGIMKAQGTTPGGVISLEINDGYMRSDVFWYSIRTLYGWSLADGILPTELRLRDVRDDFKTALSYVATARYLQLPWVHSVAVHRASRLLLWNTIEEAVRFISKVVVMSPRNDGFGVPELVDQVLAFLVHNFPADFVLDTSAANFGFPRLPPSNPTPSKSNAPTAAYGTSRGVHSRQPSKAQAQMPGNPRVSSNLRLSQIKFGDISPAESGHAVPDASDKPPARRAPTANDTILSRILLNLPFELLKQILEHPHLAKLGGDLSPSFRLSIITDIVAERESRRLRALEKAEPQLRAYQERVENAAAPVVVGNMDDYWVNNMGFKEEVFPGDLPYLVHTWSHATSSSVSA